MKPLRCDFCQGPLVMDPSREFAVCEYCGTKYMKETIQIKIEEITGHVSIDGDVKTKEADFVIRGGVLEKYNGEAIDVVIPENVKVIGNGVFQNMPIQSVIIPEGVTEILRDAFNSTKITQVKIPKSVCAIGEGAFMNTPIKQISLPSDVTFIGNSAFSSCGLEVLVIPPNVRRIGDSAFSHCYNLKHVVMPAKQTDIEVGDNIFYECKSLDSIQNAEMYPYRCFYKSLWALRKENRQANRCQYCGGEFKGLFNKVCKNCGRLKDY